MSNLFVFDLDSTLIATSHDYAEPILEMCRRIIQVLGEKAPHVLQIVAMEQEIDKRRVKEINPATGKPHFYSMERFPGSLVEVYNHICERVGAIPLTTVQDELYAIGLGAFDESRYGKNMNPGARETLEFLRARGDALYLLTKGDRSVQARKIAALEARGISFEGICIVDDGEKKESHFKKISAQFPGCSRRFSVGDSYEFDIVPAFKVGFRGIWLPVETWDVIGRMDEVRKAVDRNQCTEFASLNDLMIRYDKFVNSSQEEVAQ